MYDYFSLCYFGIKFYSFDIFLGFAYLQRLDSYGLLFSLFSFFKSLNITYSNLHIISLNMGRLIAFEFNLIHTLPIFYYQKFINNKFIYLCGIDFDMLSINLYKSSFFIFQGSFSDKFEIINQFNIIFPVGVYTEIDSTYINLEGRIRQTKSSIKMQLNILNDWEIFQTLLIIGKSLNFFNFSIILNFFYIMRFFSNIIFYQCGFFYNINQLYKKINILLSFKTYNITFFNIWSIFPIFITTLWINSIFCSVIHNYYMSDVYTRNSRTMMLCARKLNMVAFNKIFII